MYYGKRRVILTAVCAILAGCALHFLSQLLPNAVTALFSPINESIWEHGKLLFWPFLLSALWLNRGRPGGIRPWLMVLLGMTALMLAFGWCYHIVLQGEAMWVDIAFYAAVMALGFWISSRFSGPFRGPLWVLPILGAAALGILFALFTLWPPQHLLFADLSSAGAWFQIPC